MTQALPRSAPARARRPRHRVRVSPYILPGQHHFSRPEAHERAAGPKRWNRQQGLYIYRRDRLIQSGGWNRLRTMDEHSKLARIALDLPAGADGAFRTDVAKMRVGFPMNCAHSCGCSIAGVGRARTGHYRQRVRLVPAADEGPGPEPAGWSLAITGRWSALCSHASSRTTRNSWIVYCWR